MAESPGSLCRMQGKEAVAAGHAPILSERLGVEFLHCAIVLGDNDGVACSYHGRRGLSSGILVWCPLAVSRLGRRCLVFDEALP